VQNWQKRRSRLYYNHVSGKDERKRNSRVEPVLQRSVKGSWKLQGLSRDM